MAMTCSTCGAAGTEGGAFCASCGARLAPSGAGGPGSDPLVGRTLAGTYLVQQRIGAGGMGEVYRAIHLNLECPVALKIVKRELAAHSAMIHRFQREARAASRLRHPNVVAVTDFGHADGTLYMVMEFVNGRSLARVVADEAPLSERRVVNIGAQILSALSEAHAHHILHRDLKPENVMLEPRRDAPDCVKVLDFGIAKVLAEGEGASTLTQAGLVCGTPGYMSPEQLRGGELDGRSDLFSAAVVLYELLTHKLPFDVTTPMEMLHRHLSEEIPRPSVRCGRSVTPELEDVIMAALSPSADERPESAAAMRAALLASLPARTPSPRPTRASGERSRETGGRPEASGERPAAASRAPSSSSSGAVAAPASATGATPAGSTSAPRAASTPAAPRASSSPSAPRAVTWDPAVVERAARALAPYIGPMARVIVRRACGRARDIRELHELLSREIPSVADRERFRQHLASQHP